MLMRVRPNTYFGAGISVQIDDANSLERGAASALATDPNGPHVFSSGVTAHFSYDTRDFRPNPCSGQALIANAAVYRLGLGSNTDFETLEWSYDRYHRMRERDVLAFDIYGIDLEIDPACLPPEAGIEPHIDARLELETVADARIGQPVSRGEVARLGRDRPGAGPEHHPLPAGDMQPVFHLCLDHIAVAVLPEEVAAHALVVPQLRQHVPRHVAPAEARSERPGHTGRALVSTYAGRNPSTVR
ncbi:hypothetical protein [Cupriavidus lacunae]|uniref:hypothetical protein n=1 Tax=Cupriavidus lacunae TaxID=2666307 RepID=UPI001ABEFDF8|nr:hypothetical protein [Cupriavidus lacunae]